MTTKLERIDLALSCVRQAGIVLDRMITELPIIPSRRDLDLARERLAEARALRARSIELVGERLTIFVGR